MNYSVLVVGAGDLNKNRGFGRHYLTNLATMNEVKTIGIANTTQEKAIQNTHTLKERTNGNGKFFMPYEINDEMNLRNAIADLDPDMVAIVARSEYANVGDTLHAQYAFAVLDESPKCRVWTEKPFSTVQDSAQVLEELDKLTPEQKKRLFMNLPMQYAHQEAEIKNKLCSDNFGHILIQWGSNPNDPTIPVLDDLILHPLALIPEHYQKKLIYLKEDEDSFAKLEILLYRNKEDNNPVLCEIELRYGDSFRGFSINAGETFVEVETGDEFKLLNGTKNGKPLGGLRNPLRRGLEDTLNGGGIAGFETIVATQEFLFQVQEHRRN